jgi:AbrB family looped-hinge helix DNA binding protein
MEDETTTIDGAGRLVVPKPMRERLHLTRGSRVRIRDEGQRLVLEPMPDECVVVDVDGFPVIRGRLTGKLPDHRTLRANRLGALAKFR